MLLEAGIPMLEAIDALREREQDEQAVAVLRRVSDDLRQGLSLSAALSAQGQAFDPLLRAAAQASERSGQLVHALREHARYLAWQEGLRAKLVAAATYPSLLLLVGGGVLAFLLLYVMPQFSAVIDSRQVDLPWASLLLIGWGRWASAHPVVLAVAAFTALLVAVLLLRQPMVLASLTRWAWSLPWLGTTMRTIALARLYRTLGLLMSSGMPALPALQLCEQVVAMPQRQALDRARQRVHDGERLSHALDQEGLCTPVARRMLAVGERSGQLAPLLEKCAAFHDEEISQATELITRLISPALMLLMSLLVGAIVVLMYLPIFQMAEQVG